VTVWALGLPETGAAICPVVCLSGESQFQLADAQLSFPPPGQPDHTPTYMLSLCKVKGTSHSRGGGFEYLSGYPAHWSEIGCTRQRCAFSPPAHWHEERRKAHDAASRMTLALQRVCCQQHEMSAGCVYFAEKDSAAARMTSRASEL